MKQILILFVVLTCILSLAGCGTRGEPTQIDTDTAAFMDLLPPSHTYGLLASEPAPATSYKLGDVNKDDYITNTDILMLYRYIFNSTVYPLDDGTTPSPLTLGDVNKDGKISNRDILMFYKYIYDSDLYPFEENTEEDTTQEETTQPWMGPGVWM